MAGHGHVEWGVNPERSLQWCQENPGERHVAKGRGSLRYEVRTKPDRFGHLVDDKGNWIVPAVSCGRPP
jgi:hypothetical protein